MTRYDDEISTCDDFEDQMDESRVLGYREGVDRVLEYIEAIHAYPKLVTELRWAIKEGII